VSRSLSSEPQIQRCFLNREACVLKHMFHKRAVFQSAVTLYFETRRSPTVRVDYDPREREYLHFFKPPLLKRSWIQRSGVFTKNSKMQFWLDSLFRVLQAERSKVRIPMGPLFFSSIYVSHPAALWPWGRLGLQQKWVPGIFLASKELPAHKANNLTVISEPTVQKKWEPPRLTTL
jgi:hypothetical protein